MSERTNSAKMRQPGTFGQIPINSYTLVVLGFPVQQDSSRAKIISSLDNAAHKLLASFPFLSGQVVIKGKSDVSSGVYQIIPYTPHSDGKSPVRSKDYTESCPSYAEIVVAKAPSQMLDGDILCPMKGWGHAYGVDDETPVFIVQANWIRGGVLLCFASMHNALDANGQGAVIRLFAKAMRGENFSDEQVDEGNMDADLIVPFLKDGEERLEHLNLRSVSSLVPVKDASNGETGKVDASWNYWRISQSKVRHLKETALLKNSRVSTNDAVTALFMQRITAARLSNGSIPPSDPVVCFRATDMRRLLNPPIPSNYLGHLVGLAETTWTAESLVSAPISSIAGQIRCDLTSTTDHWVRSFATLVRDTQDRTTIKYGAQFKSGNDIMISSWAGLGLATCDFGPELGTPDFVRRPRLTAVPDLAYIMPVSAEGDYDLCVSLTRANFESLKRDEVWNKYAELIG